MEISWPLLLLVLLILWTMCVRAYEALRKYPPSCIGVPFLGRVPMIAIRSILTHRTNFFRELSRDGISKGDVWCTFLGQQRVIGLTSYDAIFDALTRRGNEFAWRPRMGNVTECLKVDGIYSDDQDRVGGIIMSSGELWQEQRRFTLSVMRDLGMGKNVTERKIQIEAKCLEEEFRAAAGRPLEPNPILVRTVSNVISQFVFGFRSTPENYEFYTFNKEMKKLIQEGNDSILISMMIPALEGTFISRYFSRSYTESEKKMLDFIADKVSQVEAQITDPDNQEPEHFVEAFLRRQQKEPKNSSFCRRQLIVSVYDLFTAGSETTSTFLNWAFLYLSVYRDWQRQLHEEIDEMLGNVSDIAYGDRLRCPKTLAFIDEIQRHASIVPHNGPHAVAKETFFMGHRITPDALIIPDIESVHFNPELWPEPHRFDPTRFLSEAGQYQTSKFLIPFGIGKRVCLGESLARMEIFIFLASILRSFEVDVDDKAKALKEDVLIGSAQDINSPGNHKVIMTARQQ